jgi:dihydrofolate synthase/folylpolyglutamate synthase
VNLTEAAAWLDTHLDHESSSLGVAAGAVEGLSLEPMVELMALLGNPERAVPVIHVTGTNGKGSTVAMISALLQASGLVVGEYTSPHLVRFNERIARDGDPIGDDDLAEVLGGIAAVEDLLAVRPSWFEVVTAAAFRWFAEAPVDVAVVEVGLLGRYDATNVVTAEVAVVTGVGGDHTDFAPGWELRVAQEKAGIVTPGRPVVLGRVPPDLVPLFAAEGADPVLRLGEELGVARRLPGVGAQVVDLYGVRGRHEEVVLGLHGAHQADNAAVAVAAVEELFDRHLDDEVVRQALVAPRVPGRLEVIGHQPLMVLDGAHNPDALAAMALTLEEDFAVAGSRIVVVGMLAGRDPEAATAALGSARPDLVICTTVGGDRGLRAETLAAAARRRGLPVEVVADPAGAVLAALRAAAEEDLVVVCGSFRLVAVAREVHAAAADW